MRLAALVGKKEQVMLIAAFFLLIAFIALFFIAIFSANYWHNMDIGAYLARSFFAVEKGFFVEIPYWNYGYGYVSFSLYPPFFFVVNSALFGLFSLFGLNSFYFSFGTTFLLSFFIGFALCWKTARKNALAFLLATGNFFSLGLLVIIGFATKIFAFNLCFPAIAYLLDKRKSIEFNAKTIAAFSIAMPVFFASHFFLFVLFSILYLSIILQEKKTRLLGLIPFVFVPLLSFPYFIQFVPSLASSAASASISTGGVGLSLNFYTGIFVLFIALFLIVRERILAPLAIMSACFALNLHAAIPVIRNFETHTATLFFLGIICYYLASAGAERISLSAKKTIPLKKQSILLGLLFALLLFNFFYFPQRIEKANLFNNPEYKQLLAAGEMPSVFFVTDLKQEDKFIGAFVAFQTFHFHNYSVNDWFPVGPSHERFAADEEKIVNAFKQADCLEIGRMIEKMRIKTIVVKNLQPDFPCKLSLHSDLGAFKIFYVE